MAYSKRKSVMIHELSKMFGVEDTALNLQISVESVKRAIRYARKVCLK
jgi:DNA-directed RNA polymerase specialized sigma24 family protein